MIDNSIGDQSHHQTSFAHGELVASVALLADCADRMAPAGSDESMIRGGAAERALAAAVEAERQIADLHQRIAQLERLAMTDELTGLLNRRGFENQLQRTLALSRRYGEPGLLVFIDLDRFKMVNDAHGHAAGDAALQRVAQVLIDSVRCTDIVGRLGGDEFALLLPRTAWHRGMARIEALKQLLNPTVSPWGDTSLAVYASVGVQPYESSNSGDGSELLSRADASMYESKRLSAHITGSRLVA